MCTGVVIYKWLSKIIGKLVVPRNWCYERKLRRCNYEFQPTLVTYSVQPCSLRIIRSREWNYWQHWPFLKLPLDKYPMAAGSRDQTILIQVFKRVDFSILVRYQDKLKSKETKPYSTGIFRWWHGWIWAFRQWCGSNHWWVKGGARNWYYRKFIDSTIFKNLS